MLESRHEPAGADVEVYLRYPTQPCALAANGLLAQDFSGSYLSQLSITTGHSTQNGGDRTSFHVWFTDVYDPLRTWKPILA